jgi:hypothetical protein
VVSNYNEHVLAWGVNGFDLKNRSIHSEEAAWSKFVEMVNRDRIPRRWMKRGVHMVNVAFTRSFKLRMSRPCRRCSSLIERYSNLITQVIWTDSNGECCHTPSSVIMHGSKFSRGDRGWSEDESE